jgi:hypothetical protein
LNPDSALTGQAARAPLKQPTSRSVNHAKTFMAGNPNPVRATRQPRRHDQCHLVHFFWSRARPLDSSRIARVHAAVARERWAARACDARLSSCRYLRTARPGIPSLRWFHRQSPRPAQPGPATFHREAASGSKVAADFPAATPRRSQRRDRIAKTPLCAAYKGTAPYGQQNLCPHSLDQQRAF